MKRLEFSSRLCLWVLAWFALSLGVAVASPIFKPMTTEVICSSAGVFKVLVTSEEGPVELGAIGMDCPLCLVAGAPPLTLHSAPAAFVPLAYDSQPLAAAPVVAAAAAPPPARGPPFFPVQVLKR